jgi:hypothetical protein
MMKIGDCVRHKTTGMIGNIIDYGDRKISDSYYLTTLKVEIPSFDSIDPIAEDLCDLWQIWQKKILVRSLSDPAKHKHQKIS